MEFFNERGVPDALLKQKFEERFGSNGKLVSFFSPGRVNLIGEHTDYNGGYVLPCALSFGTYAVARKRNDGLMKFASVNYEPLVETRIDQITYDPKHGWANYLKGVVVEFQKKGFSLSGLEILIDGNIPNGAGLSSSASIELLMSVVLNEFFGCGLDMLEMVKLSQRAENEFVGMNCGIMDQFAVGMGKKERAVFLDCKTLSYEYIPVVMRDCRLVIANTNKQRSLTDSKYNQRRQECEKAVEYLNRKLSIQCLGDLCPEEYYDNMHLIPEEVISKRAEHIVRENHRVSEAAAYLKEGNLSAFGRLMNESHVSLRDLYEVTGFELDALVEEAWKIDGVLGSRMTGAGFGGCTVSIVKEEALPVFMERVGNGYRKTTGLTADFYIAEIGDGSRRI